MCIRDREVAEYQAKDPITLCLNKIKEKNWATQDEIDAINQRVKDLVKECVMNSPNLLFTLAYRVTNMY